MTLAIAKHSGPGAFALAFLLLGGTLGAAQAPECGTPPMRNFGREELAALPQIGSIAQDGLGRVYVVAGTAYILLYDGARWRRIHVEVGHVSDLAADKEGKVYLAGGSSIGVFEEGDEYLPTYRSLLELLPAELEGRFSAHDVAPTSGGVTFVGRHRLLTWDGTRFTLSPESDHRYLRAAEAAGRTLVATDRQGVLQRDPDGAWRTIEGNAVLLARPIQIMAPAPDGTWIFGSQTTLWRWDGSAARALPDQDPEFLERAQMVDALCLPDGRIAIATYSEGLVLLEPDGRLERGVCGHNGLADCLTHGLTLDREGLLWVATDQGVSVVDWASPLTQFRGHQGPRGMVNQIGRDEGRLWVATTRGLYEFEQEATHRFWSSRQVKPDRVGVWSMTPDGEGGRLLATRDGVVQTRAEERIPVLSALAIELHRARSDPDVLLAGLSDGLVIVARRVDRTWSEPHVVEDLHDYVGVIIEQPEGTFWLETGAGPVHLTFPDGFASPPRVVTIDVGTNFAPIQQIGEQVFVVAGEEIHALDPSSGGLGRKLALPGDKPRFGTTCFAAADSKGTMVISSETGVWVLRGLTGDRVTCEPLSEVELEPDSYCQVYADPAEDGVFWLVSEQALQRYDAYRPSQRRPACATLITKVSFAATAEGAEALPAAHGEIRLGRISASVPPTNAEFYVEFAGPHHSPDDRVEYQTRLMGIDRDWREWSSDSWQRYRNLRNGTYCFEVRARRPGEAPGAATSLDFEIAPRWYETIWAWIAVVVALGAVLFAWIAGRDRLHRRRQGELEKMVELRTRQLAEENAAVRTEASRYETVFERSPVGLWEVDLSAVKREFDALRAGGADDLEAHLAGDPAAVDRLAQLARIVRANQAVHSALGTSTLNDLGELFRSDSPLDWRKGFVAQLVALERENRPQTLHTGWREADGRRHSIAWRASRPDDSSEAWSRVLISMTDETEQRAIEQRLHQAQKLESLGVMAGGVAHDFNNLLTAILGSAELAALDLPPDSPAHLNLDRINRASQRAAELCRQMLTYAGRRPVEPEHIELNSIVREIISLVRVTLACQPDLVLDEQSCAFIGDATQVRQVVLNLVTNASESLQDGVGVIRIRTDSTRVDRERVLPAHQVLAAGNYVRLTVEDNGCGIASEHQDRIFDPFFTTKFTGRGLGLAAVRGIVVAHGGGVDLKSAPGRGSAFTVYFPEVAAFGRGLETPNPRVRRALGGPGRVLVVGGEPDVRETTRELLESAGFQVDVATSGAAGLLRLEQEGPWDVVLLEWSLPDVRGDALMLTMKTLHPEIAVLLSSSSADEELARRVAGLERVEFLSRPFRAALLVERVRALIGAPGQPARGLAD